MSLDVPVIDYDRDLREYPVEQLARILLKDDSELLRAEAWRQFAYACDVPTKEVIKLDRRWKRDDVLLNDIISTILKHWKRSSTVNVDSLCQKLSSARCNDTSANFPQRFVSGHAAVENKESIQTFHSVIQMDDDPMYSCENFAVFRGRFNDKVAAINRVQAKVFDLDKSRISNWNEVMKVMYPGCTSLQLLYGHHRNDNVHYFALEIHDTDLHTRVETIATRMGPTRTEKDLVAIRKKLLSNLKDVAAGIDWLHLHNITYNYIRPENIVIVRAGANCNEKAKLSCIGIFNDTESKLFGNTLETGSHERWNGLKTKSYWLSPETLGQPGVQTQESDIFSFGLTCCFAISLGIHPFDYSHISGNDIGFFDICSAIQDRPPNPILLSELESSASHAISMTLSKNPIERPDIKEVLQHPLFYSYLDCLRYVVEVGKRFEQSDKEYKEELDNDYKEHRRDFDWISLMGRETYELFKKRKPEQNSSPETTPKGKPKKAKEFKYDGTSVMSFVTLVRHKDVHHTDIHPDLLQIICKGKVYKPEKYGKYITKLIPDLVMFLYTKLSRNN